LLGSGEVRGRLTVMHGSRAERTLQWADRKEQQYEPN